MKTLKIIILHQLWNEIQRKTKKLIFFKGWLIVWQMVKL